MSEIDLKPLKPAIEKFVPLGRSGLLPALHAAQNIYGWLPEPVAAEISKTLRVPLADVHGVIEFYSMYYNKPTGRNVIRVCTDPACGLRDADGVLKKLCHQFDLDPHQIHPELDLTIEPSPCLGMCDQVPAMLVTKGDRAIEDFGVDKNFRPKSLVGGTLRMLTKNCGGETTSLEAYGGYTALKKARSMSREQVVEEIKAAGLVGRGGAAFPTGIKWEGALKAQADQKYVICNADESEPGTFKDRILLLDDPHMMIEGLSIAAYAIGATKGFIYIRGEYPYIVPALQNAIDEAKAAGHLEGFEVEIRVGAGAYICGEETALFESIEGKRGFPRVKPPFPTTHGVFGKPTVINNVETLCNVPLILEKGAVEYRKIGTEKSPGPKLFCLSGDVVKPGVYEVAFGATLREVLEMAGGVIDGKKLKSVLFGGAAGAFATAEHLDVKMTFEDLRAAGLPLGSGVVMVFDETRDMRDVLKRLGHFFAHESCGKCYPCQMGTRRQMEILDRVAEGNPQKGDFVRLQDVGWTMTDASLCGLGQTAASAVLSAMKLWPDLFEVKS
ncbi:MAG: NAD(P)H-dependent oxidoreductase subunit E [Anaerolineales bacterium]|uniref:NAD(P)H-dependent oxidoreductase subunit E n=1 Tax=Candidatus Villigracilis vicinus TaxID=3140679 RepID=UPI003134A0ED|nr:NAD(P)H-dependent oxidoreductase subunit E [Anaerolineales bacterium]